MLGLCRISMTTAITAVTAHRVNKPSWNEFMPVPRCGWQYQKAQADAKLPSAQITCGTTGDALANKTNVNVTKSQFMTCTRPVEAA
mmetsp:Transcript_71395/g.119512  ORF Transcript_71395/g.119512 Transcript_71395/m.119512 type:complete len:86 (+) Transcript_71395:791-1048(+)